MRGLVDCVPFWATSTKMLCLVANVFSFEVRKVCGVYPCQPPFGVEWRGGLWPRSGECRRSCSWRWGSAVTGTASCAGPEFASGKWGCSRAEVTIAGGSVWSIRPGGEIALGCAISFCREQRVADAQHDGGYHGVAAASASSSEGYWWKCVANLALSSASSPLGFHYHASTKYPYKGGNGEAYRLRNWQLISHRHSGACVGYGAWAVGKAFNHGQRVELSGSGGVIEYGNKAGVMTARTAAFGLSAGSQRRWRFLVCGISAVFLPSEHACQSRVVECGTGGEISHPACTGQHLHLYGAG